jgi:radical SAM superfamily enzyme YgiQ (UPF0313 family)
MIKRTINYAKRLNPQRAQFSILTPYPGTRLYDKVEDRLLTRDWNFYSGLYPTIKMDHMTPGQMRKLHILAYVRFYLRLSKASENLSHIGRLIPTISKHYATRAVVQPAHLASYPVICVWKSLGWFQRFFS